MDLEKSQKSFSDYFPKEKSSISAYFSGLAQFLSDNLSLGETSKKDLVGLEINSEFIKVLKIDTTKTPTIVENYSVTATPKNAIINNEIKDPAAIAQTLKELIKSEQITAKEVALSISRTSAIIKMASIDSRLNADEIESRVWMEANRLFPNLVGEIFLDFVVIGPSAQDKNRLDVMLVACRKDQIKPLLDILKEADLSPALIDIDTYAMERALNIIVKQKPEQASWALLNISYSMITLIVIHNGALIYNHELGYDGSSLKQKLLKNETVGEEDLKNILNLHLRHALQFFYSSRPTIRIEEIILSGDCASHIPNIDTFIQKEIGKELILANPFKEMTISSAINKDHLLNIAPSLVLCCGLAMSKPQQQ